MSNKQKIRKLALEMLNDSHKAMVKKLDRVLDYGCIDIHEWSEDDAPMILPKCIVTALLESESMQYSASGTSYARRVKKEVKNIRMFV